MARTFINKESFQINEKNNTFNHVRGVNNKNGSLFSGKLSIYLCITEIV